MSLHSFEQLAGDRRVRLLFEPMTPARGPNLPNRLTLAPLTNTQSNADGTLHANEFHWLTLRAQGGFGLVKTCAIAVEDRGKGYPGQLGAWHDRHVSGLTRLAAGIKAAGAVACAQLAHSGPRALKNRVGVVADPGNQVTPLQERELEFVIQSFVTAACRCEQAGFQGVEIHAAHGFLPSQFLAFDRNTRVDDWGGTFVNRGRFIQELLIQIRNRVSPDLQLGLRLSPERFGLRLADMLDVAQTVMTDGLIDWLDISMWDVFKRPEEPTFAQKPLLSWFAELKRGSTLLGVAGKILSGESARRALEFGADYVGIGTGAILAHDFPKRIADNPNYQVPAKPVSEDLLRAEGLGEAFIGYIRGFSGFIA